MTARILRWLPVLGVLLAATPASADEAWRADFLATLHKGPARIEAAGVPIHTGTSTEALEDDGGAVRVCARGLEPFPLAALEAEDRTP